MTQIPEVHFLIAWAVHTLDQQRSARGRRGPGRRVDERGEVAQTVIIVAILAAAAISIATIIAVKFTDKAKTIPGE